MQNDYMTSSVHHPKFFLKKWMKSKSKVINTGLTQLHLFPLGFTYWKHYIERQTTRPIICNWDFCQDLMKQEVTYPGVVLN